MMELIKLEKINKKYNFNKQNQVHALKDINLSINQGELISIVGPSGSGKSTLMHIIGCLDTSTSGKYTLGGKEIDKLTKKELAKIRNKKMGFVLQQFGLIPSLSVYENISIPLYFNAAKNMKNKCLQMANQVGIEHLFSKRVDELSGGEKQRTAIARALVNNPDIILADEPTGQLDSKTSDKILELLFNLNKQGKTLIIVTHNKEISDMCTRTIEIKDGYIIKEVCL